MAASPTDIVRVGRRGGAAESLGGDLMRFSSVSARLVGFCAMALVASVVGAPGAGAAERKTDDGVLTAFESIVVQGLVGFDTRTGKSLDLAPARVVRNLVDAVTGDILGKGTTRLSIASEGSASDPRSCIKSSSRKGLTAYNPINRYLHNDNGSIQFQYHPTA